MAKKSKKGFEFYKNLSDLLCKTLFALSVLLAFLFILFKLTYANSLVDAAKYAFLETILGGTVFVAFRHYFPNSNNESVKNL